MNGAEQSRIIWVDNLKAIGIMLVLLTHHQDDLPKWFIKYVYSFHVPLFFFASGFVFSPLKYPGFKVLLVDKAKKLLVPYFILSFLSLVYYAAIAPLRAGEPAVSIADLLQGVGAIFISSNGIMWMSNGPLWFLTALFVTELAFFSLFRMSVTAGGRYSQAMIAMPVLLMSILGALDRYYVPFRLPWAIDTAMTGIALVAVGYFLQRKIKEHSGMTFKAVMIGIILAVVGLVFSRINGFVNLTFNMMGNYVYFYIAALSSIGMCVLISLLIQENRILGFIGRNSLLILGLHLPAFVAIHGIQKFLLPGIVQMLDGTWYRACIYTVLQLIILLPVIYLVNRRFRFILGRW